MKKLLLCIVAAGLYASTTCEVVTRDQMAPEQLKARLLGKYQGTVNGIEGVSRTVGDIIGTVDALSIGKKIDEITNRFIGMGSVDIDAAEGEVEAMIHRALTAIFKQSIEVANQTYRHETSDNLFAIAPWNPKIVWNADHTRVLMLTWIPAAYKKVYEDHLQSGEEMKIAWDAWVTAIPEVKEFAQKHARENRNGFKLSDRIEQFLGLIPSKPPYAVSQNKLFVEMWVRPEDIFRPCLDAEVYDKECAMDPHESDLDALPPAFRDMTKMTPMSPAHKAWFDKEKKSKYTGQWAMPWTRFGYTYDWGSPNKVRGKRAAQGATEYLIKSGSNVIIQGIIPTDNYPNTPTPVSSYTYQE